MRRPGPQTIAMLALACTLLAPLPGDRLQASPADEAHASAVRQLQQDGFAGLDRALVAFEDLVRREPAFLRAYLSAADAYVLKYEFAETKHRPWLEAARSHLDVAIARAPDLAPAYFKRAVVRLNLGAGAEAVADLEKAMDLVPTYLDPRILYLQQLLSVKKTGEARQFAQASARLFPGDPVPLRYMGDAFYRAGAYAEAVELYQGVVQLVPQAPHTYLGLGKAHQRQGQHARAVDAFAKALAQNPALSEAHFDLANSLAALGRVPEAADHLGLYLKQAPDDVGALNNLAVLYEQGGRAPEARATWLKVRSLATDGTYRERAEQHLQRLSSAGAGAGGTGADRVSALIRAEKQAATDEPAAGEPPPPDYSVYTRYGQARQERLLSESKAAEAEMQATIAERQAAAQEAQGRRARKQELQAQAAKWQEELDKQASASAQAAQAWEQEHSFGAYAKRFLGMVIQTSVGAFTGGLLGTVSMNLANQAVKTLFPDASSSRAQQALAAGTTSAITGTAGSLGQAATSAATGLTQSPGAAPRY